jgi:hypothetical protein
VAARFVANQAPPLDCTVVAMWLLVLVRALASDLCFVQATRSAGDSRTL